MNKNSRTINSNQPEPHEDLHAIVKKHLCHPDRRPISDNQQQQFEQAWNWQQQQNRPFILDSGCGTGYSTLQLAKQHPDTLIIGIDQSIKRLQKTEHIESNVLLIQARLEEFWLQALERQWHPEFQYLLYPNPWPKKKHLLRRWHGHPIFPILLKVCPDLELRTNWLIYAEEFQQALSLANIDSVLEPLEVKLALTPFEDKYCKSGHQLYKVTTKKSSN